MKEIDLITALGRLLRDGALRDAFAADPSAMVNRLAVRMADRAALTTIPFADLELQAKVLLRKRFDILPRFIPATLTQLGTEAWARFQEYGRNLWPEGQHHEILDAQGFCHYCSRTIPQAICQSELNRLSFALGNHRLALHYVRDLRIRNRMRRGLQIFFRLNANRWRETVLYPAL
ncbi:MAG: hypothetical protein JWR69_425 [Pedosphaera sp.]|nr:hypothetical protein [Pedosphaera sp.]